MSQQQASTTYTAREARDVTPSEWDGWLRDSPGGGHVLQSFAWGEFKRRFGWKPLRLMLEREGEVAGVGQFLAYNTIPVPGVLKYRFKRPWLPWEAEEAVRAFFEGASTVVGRAGARTLKIEPEVPEQSASVKATLDDIRLHEARYALNFDTTVTVDLSPPEEELLARMRRTRATASARPRGRAWRWSSPMISREPGRRSTAGWRTPQSASTGSP